MSEDETGDRQLALWESRQFAGKGASLGAVREVSEVKERARLARVVELEDVGVLGARRRAD